MSCKILPATFDGVSVKVKKILDDGTTKEMVIDDYFMIGVPSLSEDNSGYCIFAEDKVLFILSNPAANVSMSLQVTQAATVQLATLLDTFLTTMQAALTAAISSVGGTYVPIPPIFLTTMNPTFQVQQQTAQLTMQESTDNNSNNDNNVSKETSSEDIEKQIEAKEKAKKVAQEAMNKIIEQIKNLMAPIQQFLDLLKTLGNPALELSKQKISELKNSISNLDTQKIQVERKEQQENTIKNTSI